MRIACPECNAAYDVPAARLAPGLGVRCVRCAVVWVPVATEDAVPAIRSQPEPERTPEPLPPPAMAEVAAESVPADLPSEIVPSTPEPATTGPVFGRLAGIARRRPPVLVGWLVTAFILADLAYMAIAYSGPIVRAWPPAERAYAWLGLFRP